MKMLLDIFTIGYNVEKIKKNLLKKTNKLTKGVVFILD